jgi:hypothetical protein
VTARQRRPVPWALLAADEDTRRRYEAAVYRRGPEQCHWWLGSISDTGHGKLRAGSRTNGTSRVVTAHVLGWIIAYGPEPLADGLVVRHRCDEPPCQNPAHWLPGPHRSNLADYYARRGLAGHALADVRGPHGRAVAVRDAILAADRTNPEAVEAAITAALAAGDPGVGHQDALW